MKVDWKDVQEDYARFKADIAALEEKVKGLEDSIEKLTVKCGSNGCESVGGQSHSLECIKSHYKVIGLNESKDGSFISDLSIAGAKNISLEGLRPPEQYDSLMFDISGKYFLISSRRGGNIIGGSSLSMYSGDID